MYEPFEPNTNLRLVPDKRVDLVLVNPEFREVTFEQGITLVLYVDKGGSHKVPTDPFMREEGNESSTIL